MEKKYFHTLFGVYIEHPTHPMGEVSLHQGEVTNKEHPSLLGVEALLYLVPFRSVQALLYLVSVMQCSLYIRCTRIALFSFLLGCTSIALFSFDDTVFTL